MKYLVDWKDKKAAGVHTVSNPASVVLRKGGKRKDFASKVESSGGDADVGGDGSENTVGGKVTDPMMSPKKKKSSVVRTDIGKDE
jgi:hypothetical protein